MIQLQTSYADAVAPLGLKRGIEKTVTRRKTVVEYYQGLKESVEAELPEVRPGETAVEYKSRADQVYKIQQIHHRDEALKWERRVTEANARAAQREQLRGNQQESQSREMLKLAAELGLPDTSQERIRETRRIITQHKRFEEAKKDYPDKEFVKETEYNYDMLANWARKRKRAREESRTLEDNIV